MDANEYLVEKAPFKICYIPEFITKDEEEYLFNKIYSSPKPKWHQLSNRRVQQWGGIVGQKVLILDENIPKWLENLIDKIYNIKNGFSNYNKPNHVLINEYLPGQGIMPHNDGPSFSPIISTVSLNSHTILNFYQHVVANESCKEIEHQKIVCSLLLEPRSLVLISEDAYKDLLHGIDEVSEDIINDQVVNKPKNVKNNTLFNRSNRVSITIRNVPLVKKYIKNFIK